MKNLLYKELKLCLNPQIIIFSFLSLLVLIPSWPSAVAFVYLFSGISTIFPRALADKDIVYSAMLPVRKADVVKGKVLLVTTVELFSILISIPAAALKILIIDPALIASTEASDQATQQAYLSSIAPNFACYGFVFIAMGVFALVLFPWYYRNPAKINWPGVVSILAGIFTLGIGIGLQSFITQLQTYDAIGLVVQLSVLVFGLAFFAIATIIAEKKAEKNFAKVDI